MTCPKCNGEIVVVVLDARGVPEARCAECGSYIKKLSGAEVLELKNMEIEALKEGADLINEVNKEEAEDRMMCRFCADDYARRQGRYGNIYQPIDAIYCPMCGRKRKPTDKDY